MILMSFSFLIFNRLAISIDERALTAFNIVGRFEQAMFMPIYAISSAIVTLIGQNAGRGLLDRVNGIWKIFSR